MLKGTNPSSEWTMWETTFYKGTYQTNVTLLAEQCSKEEKCNAFMFNYVVSPSYLKSYSGEPSVNPDQNFRHGCYYKRITTRNVNSRRSVNNKEEE